jgi:hypothetical protein
MYMKHSKPAYVSIGRGNPMEGVVNKYLTNSKATFKTLDESLVWRILK